MCRRALICLALPVLLDACSVSSNATLSAADSTAIRSVQAAYVSAWLADDTTGVLATLDSTAVLLPPTHAPVSGAKPIREFWWPADGSRTKITSFDWTIEEMGGTTQLAYTRGVSTLSWTLQGHSASSLQVAKHEPDDSSAWRRWSLADRASDVEHVSSLV
ncbi:MAG: YybH family protein, partial [Gemmatimonadaceae bacterium]